MKTIRILGFRDSFVPNKRAQLDAAARATAVRTGFQIEPTADGFTVSAVWQSKFLTERDFADRISRDLQIASGIIFDSIVEG
jgi:hypothetical protein